MIRNYTWYNKTLDLSKPDAIQQVLAYGTIEEIEELKKLIGEEKIKKIFLNCPSKIYRPENLHFIKNYLLKIEEPIDEARYLKDTLRNTRS